MIPREAGRFPIGQMLFQFNAPANEKTYSLMMEKMAEDVVAKKLTEEIRAWADRLAALRDGSGIQRLRGSKMPCLKSRGELINMLDRSLQGVTMSALLSLCNDDCTVLGVHPDNVAIRCHEAGKGVGFTEGERESLFGGFEG